MASSKTAGHKCEHCGKSFQQSGGLKTHVDTVHLKLKPFKCDTCGKAFGTKGALDDHVGTVHSSDRKFPCQHCDKSFKKNSDLKKHVNTVHLKLKPFNCNLCDKAFAKKRNLETHIGTVHSSDSKNKEKRTHVALDVHVGTVPSSDAKFQCVHCGKIFQKSSVLKRHVDEVHLKPKPFSCILCDTAFGTKGALDGHVGTVHSSDRKFPCQHCDKSFKGNCDLKKHVNTVHLKLKPFNCILCDTAFGTKVALATHKGWVHSSDRKFPCEHCDQSFKQKPGLKIHLETVHFNLKPFKCNLCDKAFAKKTNLKTHIGTMHSSDTKNKEERGRTCDVCGRIFHRKPALKRHVDTVHLKLKPFKCDTCGKAFGKKVTLVRHVGKEHSSDTKNNEKMSNVTLAGHVGTVPSSDRKNKEKMSNVTLEGHVGKVLSSDTKNNEKRSNVTLAGHVGTVPSSDRKNKENRSNVTLDGHVETVLSSDRKNKKKRAHVTLEGHVETMDSSDRKNKKKRAHVALEGHVGKVLSSDTKNNEKRSNVTLEGHVGTVHSSDMKNKENRSHVCDVCGKRSKTALALRYHKRKVHEKGGPYECDVCGKSFQQKGALKTHVNGVHNKLKPFQCDTCGKTFDTKGTLEGHVGTAHLSATKNKVNRFQCYKCNKTYKDKCDLRKHIKLKHTNMIRSFSCKQCSSTFFMQGELNYHVRTSHAADRSYKCEKCDKSYKCKKGLKLHQRTSHGEPLRCDYCDNTYTQINNLKDHILYVHKLTLSGEKVEPFIPNCKYCDRGFFKTNTGRTNHEKVCDKRNDWKCSHCEEVFDNKKTFVDHVRNYCPERPLRFTCALCKSSDGFDSTNVLEVLEHIMTCKYPSKVKIHRCFICEQRFEMDTLSLHIQDEIMHSRLFDDIPRIFECTTCQISYPSDMLLTLHTKIEHPSMFSIITNWDNGDDDLDFLKITPENKDLLIAERKRIRDLGMQDFAFKEILPSNQCYVCRSPWHDPFVMGYHVEACEEKFGVKKKEIVQQQPLTRATKLRYKRKGKSTKLTSSTLQQLHDHILKDFNYKNNTLLGFRYWDYLDMRYNLEQGLVINNTSTILKNEPEIQKYIKDKLGDIEIMEPPRKKRKIVHIDISEEAQPDPVPAVDDDKAKVYFRRKKSRRTPKQRVNKYAPPVYPPSPTDYEDLSLWEIQGKLPQHRCNICRHPFFDPYLLEFHVENCGSQYDLPNDYIDEEEEGTCQLVVTTTMKNKMMDYLKVALGNRYRQESVGTEQYWKQLEKILNVPSNIIKKWHISFSTNHPDNKELYDNLLAAIVARQEKARQEKENKNENSTGPRLVLVNH